MACRCIVPRLLVRVITTAVPLLGAVVPTKPGEAIWRVVPTTGSRSPNEYAAANGDDISG